MVYLNYHVSQKTLLSRDQTYTQQPEFKITYDIIWVR